MKRTGEGRKSKGFLVLFATLVISLLFTQSALALTNQDRLGGSKFETAVAIAEKMYPDKVKSIVVAAVSAYPDALSAVTLANKVDAPILYANIQADYSTELLGYIKEHLDKDGTIYLMGGSAVINSDFEPKLTQLGYKNIKRLGGYDRYETNMLILNELNISEGSPLVLAYGENFPDALSISSPAAHEGWGIMLAPQGSLLDYQKEYIAKLKPSKIYVAGGLAVVSENVVNNALTASPNSAVERLGGLDRYDTSLLINKTLSPEPSKLFIASGSEFSSLLAGSVYASKEGSPILMVDSKSTLKESIKNYLKEIGSRGTIQSVITLGSTDDVSDTLVSSVNNALVGITSADALISESNGIRTYNVATYNSDLFVAGPVDGNTYTIVNKLSATNVGGKVGNLTTSVTLPYATQNVIQNVLSETITVDNNATVTFDKDDFGNTIAKVKAIDVPANGVINITVNYTVQPNSYNVTNFDLSKITSEVSEVSDQFLMSEENIDVENPAIKAKAEELKSKSEGTWDLIQDTHKFVIDHMEYDYSFNSPYSWGGAVVALNNKIGVCEDYSDLEVALLRANGIPARYVTGFGLDTQRDGSPLGTLKKLPVLGDSYYDVSTRYHAWVEIYVAPYGWIPTDPTYGDGLSIYATVGNMRKNEHIITGVGHTFAYSYTYSKSKFKFDNLGGITTN